MTSLGWIVTSHFHGKHELASLRAGVVVVVVIVVVTITTLHFSQANCGMLGVSSTLCFSWTAEEKQPRGF